MYRVIKASEVYDVFDGNTYWIIGGYTSKFANDPVTAIRYWFQLGVKHPMNTAICCRKRSEGVDLCKTATEELLTDLYSRYKCPYKLDYLIEAAREQVRKGCPYLSESPYGDQVNPFSFG